MPRIVATRIFFIRVFSVSSARATTSDRLQNCLDWRMISPQGLVPIGPTICAPVGVKISLVFLEDLDAAFRQCRGQRAAVEYAALSGTALYESHPFLQEFLVGRLVHVNGGIVGQHAVRMGHIESALLGVADLLVVEVGERDHGAPAHAAGNHAIADHADDVMEVDRPQAPCPGGPA